MAQSIGQYLFTPVNNAPLIVFRILFGAIMFMEFSGDISSGWVKEVFVDSSFHFTFIGFEFLQGLHGSRMYGYYVAACIVSAMFACGLFYRASSVVLALLWSGIYFCQKAHYNNHYYLMLLICWLMVFISANSRASLDVKLKMAKPVNECYRLYNILFIAQIWIVYTYASIAKMYPDWLQAIPVKIWFAKKTGFPLIGPLMGKDWFAYFVAYSGVIFDLLAVPALLWKPTRWLAVAGMLLFHIFNGMVFGIGVFPYLAMSLLVFFFSGSYFDNVLNPQKDTPPLLRPSLNRQRIMMFALTAYISWQVLTPLRHYLYKGDVLWTEEGHRMSWRMMLRTKSGHSTFTVMDKNSCQAWTIHPQDMMQRYQANDVATKPDFIWQVAQRLKQDFKKEGKDVSVYASAYCSLNGRPEQALVDSTVDLTTVPWLHFQHNPWVITNYK